MDTVDHRTDSRSMSLDQNYGDEAGWTLVDVLLTGGAPWGFTLKGGLEHREPLLITKVEESSKAASVRLQVGDELVNINNIPLSGYRQEAICLVKGSHKTLTLVVKRRMKMVDIVAQKMPSESDVHVARSFLTKILRSSMRRNEPVSRPHSWHSTKFNEGQSEAAKTQSTPSPVWQTRYDASSSSTDLSTGWDQTNLRRVSDQFSSLGSMDSLEHGSHPYPPGRLSPAKSNNNSVEHLGGGKRDSAYSSFSTSSGTPDYTLSKSNAASTENVLYKVSQWDSGSRHSNGRHSQNLSEAGRQDERPGYLQLPTGAGERESPRMEEQPGSRHSSSGRANLGPVWHVPDKKKATAPSPPPPPPPARSDSFAATKVHEKGLVIGYPEGPGVHAQSKPHGKSLERAIEAPDNTQRAYQASERGPEARRSCNPPPKNDALNPYISGDGYNHHQLNSNKMYSLSSTDVRVGHPPHAHIPYHQRQYSDESTFHAQTTATSAPKSQNISGYYSSMQELPTNNLNQFYSQNQGRIPSASQSSTAIDQNPDSGSHSRYYCVTSRQPPQVVSQASLVKVEDWKGGASTEMAQGGGDGSSLSSQGVNKAKYQPPQVQQHCPSNKDSNGYCKQEEYPPAAEPSTSLDAPTAKPCFEPRSQKRNNGPSAETHYMSYPPSKQTEQRRSAGPLQSSSQDPRQSNEDETICPQKTPMLHSLSQERTDLGDKQGDTSSGSAQQDALDLLNGKMPRRSDRFATTLRNEIQMKRAQLQKSMSEEEPGVWKSTENSTSSSDGSFTSIYKDHLKEAQARVLKATSFRRRDLEPVLLEHPGADALPGYPSSALLRKDTIPLPSVAEVPQSKPVSAGGQVSRIGGRKRFPAEKKVRSFSEPDKINEMGVDEDLPPPDSAAALVDRRKFFEVTRKPAFPKPIPKKAQQNSSEDHRVARPGGMPQHGSEEAWREGEASATPTELNLNEGPDSPNSVHRQALLEQQRLGTFAEYEATWNIQRKPQETRVSGRYHSADNILDPGMEERSKPSCVHERSRSSPSADFCGQNIPVQGRKSAEYSQPESKLTEQEESGTRLSESGHREFGAKEKHALPDHFPDPPPPLVIEDDPEPRPRAAHHGPLPDPVHPVQYPPDGHPHSEPPSVPKKKGSVPQRPPPPRLDKYRRPEATPPLGDSQEPLPGPQGGASRPRSPGSELSPTPVPAPPSWKDSERSKGPTEEEEPQLEPAPPPPPPQPSHGAAGLTKPTMEGPRSPSPQFAPQRLTDKPPVPVAGQDDVPARMEKVTESNTTVKKVPIKIVHAESDSEKESRQYLHPHGEAPAGPGATPVPSLGAPEQPNSPFCAYTRQRDQGPEDPEAGPLAPCGQQEPSSNGVAAVGSRSAEDEKREELARDIMDRDKTLADILDQSKMRTTMDLMEGIFPQGEQLLEGAHQRRKAAPKQASPRSAEERKEEDTMAAAVALVTSSTYYSTSAPKAELLIKMKDMQEQSEEQDSEDELDLDLASKKHELIDSLSRKLQVLREARQSLAEDVQDNNALGGEVEATVQGVCKPNELDKFRMFVGDLDKVVSLLLSLSGRLARVENALNSLEEDTSPEERRTLTEKRKLLIRQHEDAKELKENLDRRERVVYDILAGCLGDENMADYEHFVKMKSALIIEQRKLEDKIKLGEEQLKCLTDSLPLEQRMAV